MRILFSLSYYLPYISGLSIYAQRVAEGLDKRGFKVEIITSQYERTLGRQEMINNVLVTRIPYLIRFHKGLIMPLWFWQGYKKVRGCDCLVCHLPQVEGIWLLFLTKILRKKSFVVYHCDVVLPKDLLNKFVERLLMIFSLISCFLADVIVNSSFDYSRHSLVLSKFLSKVVEIYPPIKDFSQIRDSGENIVSKMKNFKCKIGFVGRLSADKGIEYLLEAIPFLEKSTQKFGIFLVGPQDAVGEKKYAKKIKSLLEKHKRKVVLLGELSDENLAYFYKNIDVLVLPSINSTEAFGMVQAEAMLCGTPVVASDLPGVREAIKVTGMGLIVRPGDILSLGQAILSVLNHPKNYKKHLKTARQYFSIEKTVSEFEKLINSSSKKTPCIKQEEIH